MAVPTNIGDPVKYIKDSKGVYHPIDAETGDIEARLSAVENKAEDNTFRIENAEEEMNDLLAELKYRSCCTLIAAEDSANGIKNIADYKCTGTDDKEQINAAIAAMGENGGRIIFAPGTYEPDNAIFIDNDNVTLEGIGNAEITFALNQFSITGKNVKIKNLNITGTGNAFQPTIGMDKKQGDFLTIEDCTINVSTAVMDVTANNIVVKFINNVVKSAEAINFFGSMSTGLGYGLLYMGNYSDKGVTVNSGNLGKAEGTCNIGFTEETE